MSFARLREEVYRVNMEIVEAGLVVLTWGNASGLDRAAGVLAIKPSGVAYDKLRARDIVIVSLATGTVSDGELSPSSDTPTHAEIYRAFGGVGGIVHTHSTYATSWAQSGREIPCLGTTHADHFYGPVPCARRLSDEELRFYERETGRVIVETFRSLGLDPLDVPGILLPHHGPFAWGPSAAGALANAIALEQIAKMAALTYAINPEPEAIPRNLLDKHFKRKHGAGAYYGQPAAGH